MDASGDPIEGQVLLLAAAKASVSADRLPELVSRVERLLDPRRDEYRREYECVYEDDDRVVFLVAPGHWERVGDELDFDRREREAVRRAHDEQLLRVGRRTDRRDEFETALDIRDAVVVGA
ncbi:hypothetical protein ACFQJD_13585 [Haloplanus sp. GCM10025708]|uniref:hypothetical protein n=1 Tax=Haloferacaceae TaxID=1644056 RepID=UPI00361FC597